MAAETLPHETTATPDQLAYLAGFFDGEGSVLLRQRGRRWEANLRFLGTNLPVMHWISEVTGASLSRRPPARSGNKASFEVCLQHKKAERWANLLLPHLRIKRAEVELLLVLRRSIADNHRKPLAPGVQAYRQGIAATVKHLKRVRWHHETAICADGEEES